MCVQGNKMTGKQFLITVLIGLGLSRPLFAFENDTCAVANFVLNNHCGQSNSQAGLLLADSSLRRRPGINEVAEDTLKPDVPYVNPNRKSGLKAIAHPDPSTMTSLTPVPDRWRLTKDLGLVKERLLDPYHRNILKADRPICCQDWFLSVGIISDMVYEPRSFPVPVASVGTGAGKLDIFGDHDFTIFNENLILALVAYKGDTVFRPPDYEYRLTLVMNYNRVKADESRLLFIDPSKGDTRDDNFVALQEAFVDLHLRNVSDRYDFDSIRFGIQPFSTDFRGFLFQDLQLGVRLFGNRHNNIFQYNLAWFRRIEKDTNSGLNDIDQDLRKDDIIIANLYWQDLPIKGFQSQFTVVHNRNRESVQDQHADDNGFIVRPAPFGTERLRDYDVTYLGFNGDGHFDRINLTTSMYYAFGDESSGAFVDRPAIIKAFFAAAEVSIDFDWTRIRGSLLYGSGDSNPFDDEARGFDAIFENPIFAGADTSYWIRQTIPLIGGGGTQISGRNGVLNSLRSSKEEGQSNFNNPGIWLFGVGADYDITPELRISTNVNNLYFDAIETLQVLRNQANIDHHIGFDLSVAAIYRPFFSQNIVFRLSGAVLLPKQGFKDLFGDEKSYSILSNLVLTY